MENGSKKGVRQKKKIVNKTKNTKNEKMDKKVDKHVDNKNSGKDLGKLSGDEREGNETGGNTKDTKYKVSEIGNDVDTKRLSETQKSGTNSGKLTTTPDVANKPSEIQKIERSRKKVLMPHLFHCF